MENWCTIEKYPSYAVSDMGRVKRMAGRGREERVLAPAKNKDGYMHISLSDADGKHTMQISRLVAKAFISNIDNLPQVDHIDWNRCNNTVTNLRWLTVSDNTHNRRKWAGTSSKYRGVHWHKQKSKWQAYITPKGCTQRNLGYFAIEEDAARAYNDAALADRGILAHLNIIPCA